MAKCPYCGSEPESLENNRYFCHDCNNYYEVSQIEKETQSPRSETFMDETPHVKNNETNTEIYKKDKTTGSDNQICCKKYGFVENIKKHWRLILFGITLSIAFITCMTCFIGIRGIYVSESNPDVFFSFTATGFEMHSYDAEIPGFYRPKKGTWSIHGNEIKLKYKQELYDSDNRPYEKKTEEYVTFTAKDNYKTLILANSMKFKRVSIIDYAANTKKVNINFINNGNKTKIQVKLGGLVTPPDVQDTSDKSFIGWSTQQYASDIINSDWLADSQRVWESETYYAVYLTKGLSFNKNTVYGDNNYDVYSLQIPKQYNGFTITKIGDNAFANYTNLIQITIPDTITYIDRYAFLNCRNLKNIYYSGTVSQWNIITKDFYWNSNTGNYTIHCSNGKISKTG